MHKFVPGTFLLGLGLFAGCTAHDQGKVDATASGDGSMAGAASVLAAAQRAAGGDVAATQGGLPGYGTTSRSLLTTFASLPDHGNLVSYGPRSAVRQQGAFTAYPVGLSEAHAINAAIPGGVVTITAPDGTPIRLTFDHIDEQPDGNWSWIGRDANGVLAGLTFGESAVFGTIPQASGDALKLTMSGGRAWMVVTDPTKLALPSDRIGGQDDQMVAPPIASQAVGTSRQVETGNVLPAAATPTKTPIDIVLGYTQGLIDANRGESAAITRLSNLVTFTNLAYQNSGITQRVRFVKAVKVNYPDTTTNASTLEKLTGYSSTSGNMAPDAAFAELRAARDTSGADLVALVRPLKPESNGCGVGWLIGANGSSFTTASAPFGYSVVSDGNYDVGSGNNRVTYQCAQGSLAHELGHNMGQQHNVEDSAGQAGEHPYSYGYREASGGFYTVMAYQLAGGQTEIPYFANPLVTYLGRPTGVANQSDNTRSMNQTMAIVAKFRNTVVPVPGFVPSLIGINKQGATATQFNSLTGAGNYQTFGLQAAVTALGRTGNNSAWVFEVGDYNGDGVVDLYAILKNAAGNKTEVHVLNGADSFKSYLLHTSTVLPSTGSDSAWVFKLGDYNKDGKLDLWAISKLGASGSNKTEIRVLDGATRFSTYLLQTATVLGKTGSDDGWKFELADDDGDGILDLFAFNKGVTSSGKTEMRVISGASNFQTYLRQVVTGFGLLGVDNSWELKLGDYNGDGVLDLYGIAKAGASGKTEVHVLDGATNFQIFTLHIASVLPYTGTKHAWEFFLVAPTSAS